MTRIAVGLVDTCIACMSACMGRSIHVGLILSSCMNSVRIQVIFVALHGAIERMLSDYKYCQGQTTSITAHAVLPCLPGIQLSRYEYEIRKQYTFLVHCTSSFKCTDVSINIKSGRQYDAHEFYLYLLPIVLREKSIQLRYQPLTRPRRKTRPGFNCFT